MKNLKIFTDNIEGQALNQVHNLLEQEAFSTANDMKYVYTSTANQSTIDESPRAYKTMEEIIYNIAGTVKVLKIIKPIYNFKAAE